MINKFDKLFYIETSCVLDELFYFSFFVTSLVLFVGFVQTWYMPTLTLIHSQAIASILMAIASILVAIASILVAIASILVAIAMVPIE